MLILLPPSESKTAVAKGAPVRLSELSFPELTEAREIMLERLAEVSAAEDALDRLGVGQRLEAEVRRNTTLAEQPAGEALGVYTGVLYEALEAQTLNDAARAAARESLLIFSALWGVVGPRDRIPTYRASIAAKIAPKGGLAAWWKGELAPVLDRRAADELIIDCRSSGYAAMWAAPAEQTVSIRAERVSAAGRKVVSHMAKHYRGEVARLLLESGANPASPQELAAFLMQHLEVELEPSGRRRPAQLTVVIRED